MSRIFPSWFFPVAFILAILDFLIALCIGMQIGYNKGKQAVQLVPQQQEQVDAPRR